MKLLGFCQSTPNNFIFNLNFKGQNLNWKFFLTLIRLICYWVKTQGGILFVPKHTKSFQHFHWNVVIETWKCVVQIIILSTPPPFFFSKKMHWTKLGKRVSRDPCTSTEHNLCKLSPNSIRIGTSVVWIQNVLVRHIPKFLWSPS